jgi:hypothetical protein
MNNESILKNIWVILFLSVFSSCSTTVDHTSVDEVGKKDRISALTYNASMRSIMVKGGHSIYKFCAQPEPDVGEAYSSGVHTGVKGVGTSEGAADETSTSVIGLGGRNSTLLLSREILYRVCEMGVNHNATYEQQSQAFFKALHALVLLGNESQAKFNTTGGEAAKGGSLEALVDHIKDPVVN